MRTQQATRDPWADAVVRLRGVLGGSPEMGPPPSPNRADHPYAGCLNVQGIPVLVENVPGSVRSGTSPDGKAWHTRMRHFYGEIAGTAGSDGDAVDVFVGPDFASEMVYVVHQRIPPEAEGGGGYDEDKLMIGFDSREDALAAFREHYDKPDDWEGGVSEISVDDLKARLEVGDLQDGLAVTMAKAGTAKPPGAGWEHVPGGKHGGYRRRTGKGRGYEYWYPGHVEATAHPYWHRDLTRASGTGDLKPGELVEVGGRSGIWRWTPEHKAASEGLTWVTSEATGEHQLVRSSTLYPVKGSAEPQTAKRPRRPPVAPGGPKRPPPPPPTAGPRKPPPAPPQGQETPSAEARRSMTFDQSQAKPGTVLHDLEHGAFMLARFKGRHDEQWREGVNVPKGRQRDMLLEFRPLIEGAARKIAKRYGINPRESHAAWEELVAGSTLGFVLSLTSYRGGSPFLNHAQQYAIAYARSQARSELGAGVTLPDRTMRHLAGFLAARTRARAQLATEEPTPEQIARVWRVRKGDVYMGRADLGTYTGPQGGEIDQTEEQVPDGPWRVRGPNGREQGNPLPGKLQLAKTMAEYAQGGKVEDDDWLAEQPATALPHRQGTAFSVGTALHLRSETDDILADLPDKHRQVLEMKFGFHSPDGESATADEIARTMGIAQGKPEASVRREVGQLVEDALRRFKEIAAERKADVRRHVEGWARIGEPGASVELDERIGPSHRELHARFGNDESVRIYLAAIRAGRGDATGRVLDRELQGKATREESARVRAEYHEQRDRERLEAFRRYRARPVDPSEVRETAGTSAEAEWLYPDDLLTGYMTARIKRGSGA